MAPAPAQRASFKIALILLCQPPFRSEAAKGLDGGRAPFVVSPAFTSVFQGSERLSGKEGGPAAAFTCFDKPRTHLLASKVTWPSSRELCWTAHVDPQAAETPLVPCRHSYRWTGPPSPRGRHRETCRTGTRTVTLWRFEVSASVLHQTQMLFSKHMHASHLILPQLTKCHAIMRRSEMHGRVLHGWRHSCLTTLSDRDTRCVLCAMKLLGLSAAV